MKVITSIPATTRRLNILGSVIGQMSDGIWENTRSMEKYWKSLDYGTTPDDRIYLEDRDGVCTDVLDFFANKIKQIIKIEIEDGVPVGFEWSRTCAAQPSYFHGDVTVGECYQMYELLKGRDISKKYYATISDYTVELSYGSAKLTFVVSALNESDAKKKAIANLAKNCAYKVTKD